MSRVRLNPSYLSRSSRKEHISNPSNLPAPNRSPHIRILPHLPRPNRHPQHLPPPNQPRHTSTTHHPPRPHHDLPTQSRLQTRARCFSIRVHQLEREERCRGRQRQRQWRGTLALALEAETADEGGDLGCLRRADLGRVCPAGRGSFESGRRVGGRGVGAGHREGEVVRWGDIEEITKS